MLSELHIKNIAVIEEASIEFEPGLNVLTGETGAGKSIVIDALGAVIGTRVGRDMLRTGAEKVLSQLCSVPKKLRAGWMKTISMLTMMISLFSGESQRTEKIPAVYADSRLRLLS